MRSCSSKLRWRWSALAAGLLVSTFFACGGSSSTGSSSGNGGDSSDASSVATVTAFTATATTANRAQLSATLSETASVTFTCTATSGEAETHSLPTVSGAATYHSTVDGLRAESTYSCCAQVAGQSGSEIPMCQSITTAALPQDLQGAFTISGDTEGLSGYFILNFPTDTTSYIIVLDPSGNIRATISGYGGSGDIDTLYLGNQQILSGGRGISGGGQGGVYHAPVRLDWDGNVLWTATSEKTVKNELAGSFNHDAGISETGDSLFTLLMTYVENAKGIPYLQGFIIKEIGFASNAVRWSWDVTTNGIQSGALPAPAAYQGCGTDNSNDMYHANAVLDRLEPNPSDPSTQTRFLYLSLRDLNQVVKIDTDTKAVVWKLGLGGDFKLIDANGAPLPDSDWFLGQHDVQIYEDGTLSIYDNGYDQDVYCPDYSRTYSRAIRLKLDENAKTAQVLWQYSEANWSDPILGSVNWLADQSFYVVGIASKGIRVVDPTGTALWKADYAQPMPYGLGSYRVRFIPGCTLFNNRRYCD